MKRQRCRQGSILAAIVWLSANVTQANDIRVSNVSLINTNALSGKTEIRFDLRWSNSWRRVWCETNTAAGATILTNWDAAWVFAKYRPAGTTDAVWQTAYLDAAGHTAPAGVAISVAANGGVTNVGAFIYRSAAGKGGLNLNNARLCWNYTANNVNPTGRVDIAVYAIEMVYIPKGSFNVGDGATTGVQGQFAAGSGTTPFLITNETDAITLGGGAGNLGNRNASGMYAGDDFNNAVSQTLPASFPRGYRAFYCMKYEISQEQFKDFLNSLTRAQQTNLVTTTNASWFALSGTADVSYGNGIRIAGDVTSGPLIFGCDYNANGILNETNDGQDIACNFIALSAGAAYADWAGLRPMTALEFEKACRGPKSSVANEYAWGSTSITRQTNYSGAVGSGTEKAMPTTANSSYGNHASVAGPTRAGIYATTNSTRAGAGAGYCGVMDLCGNVREPMISVGHALGRAFTGTHGDGALSANGSADAASWPATAPASSGWAMLAADWFTAWTGSSGYGRISSRRYGAAVVYDGKTMGFRAVRTAP